METLTVAQLEKLLEAAKKLEAVKGFIAQAKKEHEAKLAELDAGYKDRLQELSVQAGYKSWPALASALTRKKIKARLSTDKPELPARRKPRTKITEAMVKAMVDGKAAGKTALAIAKELRLSKEAVYDNLDRAAKKAKGTEAAE